jgi:hypothetical protein
VFKPMENAMLRILLPFSAALVACTPSPQDTAMRNPIPVPDTPASTTASHEHAAQAMHAAQGPIPAPVSAAENLAPAMPADSREAGQGRRTLSTAFVRVGPDRHLAIELRDGRVLVLRDMVMGPAEYCGVQVLDGLAGKRYCGGYADVASANPGGAPAPVAPDAAVSNPVPDRRP